MITTVDTTKEEYTAEELIALLTGSAQPSQTFISHDESDWAEVERNESYQDMTQRLVWEGLQEADPDEVDWSEFSCPLP